MNKNNDVFSIYELNNQVKFCLEHQIGSILLLGEISNFVHASSGHWYFSLKDERAQVRCAMFKGSQLKTNLMPKNGQKVLVKANVTLYEPRGEYQLIITQMQLDGIGALQQRYEQLKQQLQLEGLFDLAHKKSLPTKIKTIGVITSPTGAAFHDICTVLKRRDPNLNIILYPSLVQGHLAAQNIVFQIENANRRKECDVLIIGRGGGSLEDLWAFNEEIVARAIFKSQLFTVSAVGHEIDFTISDFVADIRAATPSAAAELMSQDRQIQIRQLEQTQNRLNLAFDYFLIQKQSKLMQLRQKLERLHPKVKLIQQQSTLNETRNRLINAFHLTLQPLKERFFEAKISLSQTSLSKKIALYKEKLTQFQPKLTLLLQRQFQQHKTQIETANQAIRYLIQQKWLSAEKKQTQLNHAIFYHSPLQRLTFFKQKQDEAVVNMRNAAKMLFTQKCYDLKLQAGQLQSVSPLATLARGYSVTQDEHQQILISTQQVKMNEVIITKLSNGVIKSKVIELVES